MKKLTNKENEIMNHFWDNGPMFIKELQALYPEPRPHVNTLSTLVRILESKGLVSHTAFGNTYRYQAAVSREQYGKRSLNGVITNLFGNSYLKAVSSLVEEEKISVEELKELIRQIEEGKDGIEGR